MISTRSGLLPILELRSRRTGPDVAVNSGAAKNNGRPSMAKKQAFKNSDAAYAKAFNAGAGHGDL